MPKTLLLIEDSGTMRQLVRLVLENEDMNLIESDNPTDGINNALNHEPDLIIADESLEGKGAMEICDLLKSEYGLGGIPFLVLSGQIHSFDHSQANKVGVDEVMGKPFEAKEFVDTVRSLLDRFADQPKRKASIEREDAQEEEQEEEVEIPVDEEIDSAPVEEPMDELVVHEVYENIPGATSSDKSQENGDERSGGVDGVVHNIFSEEMEPRKMSIQYKDPVNDFFDNDSTGSEEKADAAAEPGTTETPSSEAGTETAEPAAKPEMPKPPDPSPAPQGVAGIDPVTRANNGGRMAYSTQATGLGVATFSISRRCP